MGRIEFQEDLLGREALAAAPAGSGVLGPAHWSGGSGEAAGSGFLKIMRISASHCCGGPPCADFSPLLLAAGSPM